MIIIVQVYSGAVSTNVFGMAIMLLLIIGFVMNILMLNLVIAVMSEAYEDIKETSQAMWCLEQFQLLDVTMKKTAMRWKTEQELNKSFWARHLTGRGGGGVGGGGRGGDRSEFEYSSGAIVGGSSTTRRTRRGGKDSSRVAPVF
jgi:hypothetical protein